MGGKTISAPVAAAIVAILVAIVMGIGYKYMFSQKSTLSTHDEQIKQQWMNRSQNASPSADGGQAPSGGQTPAGGGQ